MVTVSDLASYLSLNPDNTEDLTGFLSAAKTRARLAGIPSFERNALYDQFIKELAGYMHDNRSLSAESEIQDIVNSYVLMLRYGDEDPEEPDEPDNPVEPVEPDEGGDEE